MQQEWPDAKRYGSVLKSSTVNATGMAWRKEVWVCIKTDNDMSPFFFFLNLFLFL